MPAARWVGRATNAPLSTPNGCRTAQTAGWPPRREDRKRTHGCVQFGAADVRRLTFEGLNVRQMMTQGMHGLTNIVNRALLAARNTADLAAERYQRAWTQVPGRSWGQSSGQVSFDLNPGAVLAAVRKRGAQQPDADAHAGSFGVEMKFPLVMRQLKLISRGGRTLRRRVNRIAGRGRIGVFDD